MPNDLLSTGCLKGKDGVYTIDLTSLNLSKEKMSAIESRIRELCKSISIGDPPPIIGPDLPWPDLVPGGRPNGHGPHWPRPDPGFPHDI
jgi:hypothetical protein